ncbi:MAG: cation transporter [Methyloligellaceae bacterium]
MAGQCGCSKTTFEGLDDRYIKILWIIIAINGIMFFVEMLAGYAAQSQALKADALDFLGDTLTYGLSLWVIGKSITLRTNAALLKSFSLLAMSLMVLTTTIYRIFVLGSPDAMTMSSIAILALSANLLSVLLLFKYKDGDSNIRSVWLCSRNDAIGNLGVLAAGVAVWWLHSPWPDLLVALLMSGLFFSSARQIFIQARAEQNEMLDATT